MIATQAARRAVAEGIAVGVEDQGAAGGAPAVRADGTGIGIKARTAGIIVGTRAAATGSIVIAAVVAIAVVAVQTAGADHDLAAAKTACRDEAARHSTVRGTMKRGIVGKAAVAAEIATEADAAEHTGTHTVPTVRLAAARTDVPPRQQHSTQAERALGL